MSSRFSWKYNQWWKSFPCQYHFHFLTLPVCFVQKVRRDHRTTTSTYLISGVVAGKLKLIILRELEFVYKSRSSSYICNVLIRKPYSDFTFPYICRSLNRSYQSQLAHRICIELPSSSSLSNSSNNQKFILAFFHVRISVVECVCKLEFVFVFPNFFV